MGVRVMTNALASLIEMTRALGEPSMNYVIIGEGNTSLRLDEESFLVKASGHQMRNIDKDGFVAVRIAPMLAMLDDPPATLSEQKVIAQAAVLAEGPGQKPVGGSQLPRYAAA